MAITTWKTSLMLAIGFVFFWNSGFIGAEYALPNTGPFTLLFWRYWALVLVMLVYLIIRKRMRIPSASAMITALVVGFLAHGIWLLCVFFSLQWGVPAGIIALVVALQPMTTGAFSGLASGEPTSLRRWFGLLIGFAGVATAVLYRVNFSNTHPLYAYLVPFGSVIAITIASLTQRRVEIHQPDRRLPIDLSLFYQALGTALAMTLPAIFLEQLETRWTTAFVLTMGWLIIAVSLLAYMLMWMLIQRLDATRVASLFYLGPPVTMLMAWSVFGDVIQLFDIIGLLIVLAGVGLTQIPDKKPLPGR